MQTLQQELKIKVPHEKRTVRLKFTSPVLGSAPNSEELYENYIVTKLIKEIERLEKKYEKLKNKDPEEADRIWAQLEHLKDELANAPEVPEQDTKKTIFYRDPQTGHPVIRAHQIQGFLKETANNYKDQFGIKAFKDKISRYVRIFPTNIPIFFDGEQIEESDLTVLERPLRAWLPNGQQIVSIAVSEQLDEGAEIEFDLIVFKNKEFDIETVLKLFDYGVLGGLGQWRTGGFGSFEVVKIEKTE